MQWPGAFAQVEYHPLSLSSARNSPRRRENDDNAKPTNQLARLQMAKSMSEATMYVTFIPPRSVVVSNPGLVW